jgi:hypothetical protein
MEDQRRSILACRHAVIIKKPELLRSGTIVVRELPSDESQTSAALGLFPGTEKQSPVEFFFASGYRLDMES